MAPSFAIRPATPADLDVILGFIRDLARYEKLEHEVVATRELLDAALFGAAPRAFAMIAESDRTPAGFALCYYTFSTFVGRPGIYLEDVYVAPERRGQGIGRAFFQALARRAVAENCGRIEWAVLDWNQPALDFYAALGAEAKDEWRLRRLSGAAIAKLAA